jgi:Calcineurin-like phosphoesterase
MGGRASLVFVDDWSGTMAKAAVFTFQYLFRYRDLVAETLKEHRKIIDAKGACWWGWWKRPTENDRIEIWKSLQKNASQTKPVRVGLFDSGTGLVHLADVIDIVLPKADGQDGQHPRVLDGEEALIPAYYRASPFSMAWMKLKKIESKPEPLINEYSFAEAPNLPNYPKLALERFKDKVIAQPDELRGMDTTIWVVRKKKPSDNPQSILLTLPGVPHPISSVPIAAKGKSILHLTDLHFALGAHRKQHLWKLEGEKGAKATMAEAITNATKDEGIGLVVVTGDLTFLGSKSEFGEASKSLFRMLGILNLGPEHFIIVPGNHDVVWRANGPYTDGAEVKAASDKATQNYREFYSGFFRHEPNQHLSMGRKFVFPSGVV